MGGQQQRSVGDRVTSGDLRPTQITWSRRLPTVLYFRDSFGRIHAARIPSGTISPPSGSSDTAKSLNVPLPFKAKMTIRDAEVYAEMFEQSWRSLADHFYDPKLHGVNWEAVRERYRPLVKHVGQKEDLYSLLYLMMGELNASHLGVAGRGKEPEQETADLGLLFDDSYRGRGLKVAEVLKRGPADRRGLTLRPGEYVLAIDGTELLPQTNVSRVLNDKVNEKVVLLVAADPAAPLKDKAVRRVEIKAVSRATASKLLYERLGGEECTSRQRVVQGQTGLHPHPDMNEAGLERFVRSLYSDNFDKEAIVLDVRYNGGGFTHEQVLNYLGSPGAHLLPPPPRRRGHGAAFLRPQMEPADGAADQQSLLQRRGNLPARLPHARPGQAGRSGDGRFRHRHDLDTVD